MNNNDPLFVGDYSKESKMSKRKILVSSGYGAGWSTWNHEYGQQLAEYQPIINFLDSGGSAEDIEEKFGEELHNKFPGIYLGGASDLVVVEVVPPYYIKEYDGHESVVTETDEVWFY